MDGTLTDGYSWERFHALAGIPEETNRKWFWEYVNKKITFQEWMDLKETAWKKVGVQKDDIMRVSNDMPFLPGVEETIEALKTSYQLCLVSSSIDVYVGNVARHMGIDDFHAYYSLAYSNGSFASYIYDGRDDDLLKVEYLKTFAKKYALAPEEIVFVGDSYNDLKAFAHTGRGILVHSSEPELRQAAWKYVDAFADIVPIIKEAS